MDSPAAASVCDGLMTEMVSNQAQSVDGQSISQEVEHVQSHSQEVSQVDPDKQGRTPPDLLAVHVVRSNN